MHRDTRLLIRKGNRIGKIFRGSVKWHVVEVGCIKHGHLSLRLVICGKILYNLVIGPFGDIMTRTLPKLFLVFFCLLERLSEIYSLRKHVFERAFAYRPSTVPWPSPLEQKPWLFVFYERFSYWSNFSDLTRPGPPNDGFSTGIFPISGKSRLVKYYFIWHDVHRFLNLQTSWCWSLTDWYCWWKTSS